MIREILFVISLIHKVISVTSEVETGILDYENNENLLFRSTNLQPFETEEASLSSTNSRRRRKRIISGQSLDPESHYILDFQAAIFPGQFCNNIDIMTSGFDPSTINFEGTDKGESNVETIVEQLCSLYQTNPHCSGTAITPTIVQTACHCIARPIYRTNPSKEYEGFIKLDVFNSFEDLTMVKIGATNLTSKSKTSVAEMFIVHEKCTENHGYVTYDFGLIVAKLFVKTYKQLPATVTYDELLRERQYIESRELVCMVVGWGFTDIVESKRMTGYATYERGIHYGWHVLTSRYECYLNDRKGKHFEDVFPNTTVYREKATWVCHKPFGRLKSVIAAGDAGGPVICLDDVYYAIQQWHYKKTYTVRSQKPMTMNEISGAAPLAYNPVPNTATYQDVFQKSIIDERSRLQTYIARVKQIMIRKNIPGTRIDNLRTNDSSKSYFHWSLILMTLFLNN